MATEHDQRLSNAQSLPPANAGRRLRGPLALITLLLALWTGALIAVHHGQQHAVPPRATGLHGSQLPPGVAGAAAFAFTLTDARGGQIAAEALRGRPYALTFLYSQCPDVCPLIGQELRIALEDLGAAAARVAVVAISVDPHGDTGPAVRSWLQRQREPANFHYAIGTEQQLSPIWNAYHAAPQISGRPETSTHTAAVWLVDARGRLRASYPAGAPLRPEEISDDLRVLLGEAAAANRQTQPR